MEIKDAIKKSELTLIEGDKKIGKLTFALFSVANFLNGSNLIIFSPLPKPLMLKRLESIAYLGDEKIINIIKSTKLLCMKENIKELKIRFGNQFMIEDIKKGVEKYESRCVIFHRFDLFFEIQEREDAEEFMEKMITLKEKYQLKLFITSSTTQNNNYINDLLENYTDINLLVQKNDIIKISVQNSIFPIQPSKFIFILEKNHLLLKPIEMIKENSPLEKKSKEQINKKVLLISQDEKLIKLHKFLFRKDIFQLDIATTLTETIQKILERPDLIIYNPHDDSYGLEVCNIIKKNNLQSKLIYIVNKNHVRNEDKMSAIHAGCYEVVPKNFTFEEYILILEKALNNNFYTSLIKQLPSHKKVIKNLKHFCDIIDNFWQNGLCFTIVLAKTNINKEKIIPKIREKDIIFYDNGYIAICLLNMLKAKASIIIDKIKSSFNQEKEIFEVVTITDAITYKEEKNKVCNNGVY